MALSLDVQSNPAFSPGRSGEYKEDSMQIRGSVTTGLSNSVRPISVVVYLLPTWTNRESGVQVKLVRTISGFIFRVV